MTVNFSTHHQGELCAIDLFGGPGGWDIAARSLGVDPLGIELDDAACATREAAGLRTIPGDVAALDPHEFIPAGGHVDLLIASPPCQAWSTAGKQAGKRDQAIVFACLGDLAAGNDTRAERLAECEDDRSLLVVEPLRWALDLCPRLIAFEQVPPVLEVWTMIAQILAGRGYSTWAGILSAEQYGVPQTRERAILLANRDGQVVPPAPTHAKYVKPKKEREHDTLFEAPREVERIVRAEDRDLLPWVSMAEALGWGEGGVLRTGQNSEQADGYSPFERSMDAPAPVVLTNADRWRFRNGNQENAAERDLGEPAPTLHFGARSNKVDWVYDRHQVGGDGTPVGPRPVSEPAPTLGAQGLAKGRDQWTRDRPAPTIVTSRRSKDGILVGRQLPEGEGENVGGHNWPSERPSTTVNGDPRISKPGRHDPEESGSQQKDAIRVSEEEALILQSFPGDYPVRGTKSQRYLQIGNAVPPLLAKAILEALVPAELLPAAVEPEQKAAA